MRLLVTLESSTEFTLPVNYQHLLTAAVYSFLDSSDNDYAKLLHDEGYGGEGGRHFKLFAFSWLRGRSQISGPNIQFAAGEISWLISSPINEFIQHFATGMLAQGNLRVGNVTLPIRSVGTCPAIRLPANGSNAQTRMTCLSPMVASLPTEGGQARYLTPADGTEFSEAIRRNLLQKYRLIHAKEPGDAEFQLNFDSEYLKRASGTKLIEYKTIHVKGAFAPFSVSGSAELIQLGYDAGFGEKNAGGFGMVELSRR